jgi:hypothetical protein
MANNLCSVCIEDAYLRAIVENEGVPETCDSCGEERANTITIAHLGELLEPILRENIALGQEVKRFSLEDDDGWWEQEGDDLDYFVQEALGQYFDFNDEIIQAVVDAEDCWPPDGDEPFFDTSFNYVEKHVSDYALQLEWKEIKDELRSRRRFFSSAAKHFFDALFGDVDTLLSHAGETDGGVVQTLPVGFTFYRSRVCDSRELMEKMAALNLEVQHFTLG